MFRWIAAMVAEFGIKKLHIQNTEKAVECKCVYFQGKGGEIVKDFCCQYGKKCPTCFKAVKTGHQSSTRVPPGQWGKISRKGGTANGTQTSNKIQESKICERLGKSQEVRSSEETSPEGNQDPVRFG